MSMITTNIYYLLFQNFQCLLLAELHQFPDQFQLIHLYDIVLQPEAENIEHSLRLGRLVNVTKITVKMLSLINRISHKRPICLTKILSFSLTERRLSDVPREKYYALRITSYSGSTANTKRSLCSEPNVSNLVKEDRSKKEEFR